MSPRPRIAPASMASAAVIGIIVAMGVAPGALAEPCTGAAAAAQPPAAPNTEATPPLPGGPPVGHRPRGTDDSATAPQLGLLQQQAQVRPPTPPAAEQQQAPVAAPQPPPAPAPPGTSIVGWVTGPQSPNDTIGRFAVTGTDLGIMWDNGDPANRQVLMAFGDTYGYCGVRGQQWRYNTLFRTQDGALSRTVAVPDGMLANRYSGSPLWAPGLSKQIINSTKWAPNEKGIIPTAGIAVGTTQYVNFMSIRSWDSDGRWTTNFSAIAVSPDNGENWGVYPGSVRSTAAGDVAGAPVVPGNQNFQQGAFLRPGPGDPYLYSFGTPSGRGGSAYIARVAPDAVPDPRRYEYWNADRNDWVTSDPAAATPVIPGPVGEMSAQFNTHLGQYLVLYCNGANDVVARTSPAPQGPWGPERVLARSAEIPGGIYAPFLHPWSTGKELYFNLSQWSTYNVMLMRSVLP
ncbi:DUF4185 domain-containing protein [Mycobacterium sp. IDR2000157661]|uniref:DUF4185 domain-containing protein n=1 Tax=Mycobacterium sp. IDR2000157661 TaxID=2867005 RepID=UPI001EEA8EBF|nr:DUF4185 domain-containing protein [Mycobacterium sp. IDR2000157661]ULE33382.1 DUF4185 domain-containing protein [Mycobacterium sp. IDR2000157661]